MRRILTILISALCFLAAVPSAAQDLFIGKGNIQVGLQAAYLSANTDNSEYFLLLNPVTAKANATVLSPYFEYAYANNKGYGLRMQSLKAEAMIDNLTLDLLNDGLSFGLENSSAMVKDMGASIYRRAYYNAGQKGRLGVFTEFSLGYSRGRTQFAIDSASDSFARTSRIKFAFSPGIMFFVMNQVSASLSVSMANISYTKVDSFKAGNIVGTREKFAARAGIDVLGINFGVSLHL